jgi:hypothetical protein
VAAHCRSMTFRYEVRAYLNHTFNCLIVCFLVTLPVPVSKLIEYTQNIKRKSKKNYSYLIHTQILNSDAGTALRNSKETRNSYAVALCRHTLPTAEKRPEHSFTPRTITPFPYAITHFQVNKRRLQKKSVLL